MMRVRLIVSGIVVLTSVVLGCGAKQSPTSVPSSDRSLDERIHALAQPLIDDGWTQGMIVGVLQGGKKSYFSFGSISDDQPIPPDESTVFEIGSISKVFTAITLAEMVTKKELALSDPLGKFLPDDIHVPSPGGKPITLENLAAHVSGLAHVPTNFWKDGDNIYDNDVGGLRWGSYSEDQVRDYFESPSPPLDESRMYIYSNLGAGLLGYALEQASNEPLENLIVERVCKPLGMHSTSFSIEPTAQGHDADGNRADAWPVRHSVLGGAFALRSTCSDMLAFAKANLDLESSQLADSLKSAQQPRGQINELEHTALGWKLNKFGVIYTTGTTGGFRSALFLHTPTKTAVMTMANTQVGGATGGRAAIFDAFAGSLLNVALGAPPITIDFPSPSSADSATLEDFAGDYRPADGSPDPSFPIRVENEKLLTVGPGNMELRLWPKGDDKFFLRSYVADFTFLRDESGNVSGLDLAFEGNKARLKRQTE